MTTIAPLTNVGVSVGSSVDVGVSEGIAVSIGAEVLDGTWVGVSDGNGVTVRVGSGVYVGNKPISRKDESITAKAKQLQQHKTTIKGISGKASFLPETLRFTLRENNFRSAMILIPFL
jgi:hypothetical protein